MIVHATDRSCMVEEGAPQLSIKAENHTLATMALPYLICRYGSIPLIRLHTHWTIRVDGGLITMKEKV